VLATERLTTFDRPALIAWGQSRPVVPHRRCRTTRSHTCTCSSRTDRDARTYVHIDQPQRSAEL